MKPSIVLFSSLLWTTTTTFVDAKSRASSSRAFLVRPTTNGGHRPTGLVSFHSLPRGGGGGGGGGQYSHDPSGGYYPEDDADPYSSSSRNNNGRRPNNDDYYYGGEGTDRDYYPDQDGGMDRRGSGGSSVGSVLTDLPQMIKTGNRKIGLPMLAIGAALTVLGVSLFFNKTLMRLGNLFFVAGVPMTIGAGRTAGYFLQSTKMRATGCLSLGIFLVFIGWPVFGIALEAFGMLNLFGNMFPLAMAVLKTMPVIGPLLKGGDSGTTQNRSRGSGSRYSAEEDEDYYGGRGNDGYDRGYYDDGQDNDEDNRRYY